MTPSDRQLVLPLAHRPQLGQADFLTSASNLAAFAAVTAAPVQTLILSGPKGAGKSHLASIWGQGNDAALVRAADLTDSMVAAMHASAAVVIEDADSLTALPDKDRRPAEAMLFHAINLCRAEQTALLITGRTAPGYWDILTPDLASRLEAMNHVPIDSPDDDLLSSILNKLLGDRQIAANSDLTKYLVLRMERSFAAAQRIVDHLDRKALARRRAVTRALAAEIYADDPGILTGTGET
ncbi:MAG: hypothetical protein AAF666_11575 [Pseudomonadota bacterium]